MVNAKYRRKLSAPGPALLRIVRNCFRDTPESGTGRKSALSGYLMSALAIFTSHYHCLRAFECGACDHKAMPYNLKRLSGLPGTPCEMAVQERLIAVDPFQSGGTFRQLLAAWQPDMALAHGRFIRRDIPVVSGWGG